MSHARWTLAYNKHKELLEGRSQELTEVWRDRWGIRPASLGGQVVLVVWPAALQFTMVSHSPGKTWRGTLVWPLWLNSEARTRSSGRFYLLWGFCRTHLVCLTNLQVSFYASWNKCIGIVEQDTGFRVGGWQAPKGAFLLGDRNSPNFQSILRKKEGTEVCFEEMCKESDRKTDSNSGMVWDQGDSGGRQGCYVRRTGQVSPSVSCCYHHHERRGS